MTAKTLYTRFLLIIGIIVFINLITNEFFLRLDFTENKEYTLSKATKNILTELEDPITIKVYFSENTPPQIQKIKRDLQDLLVEYSTISKGKIAYNFIDPDKNEKTEKEAINEGIQPININVREKNEMKVQKAFMGVKIRFEDKQEIIPVVHSDMSLEYELSTSIKKVSSLEKENIAFYNKGIDFKGLNSSMKQLSVLYDIKAIDFENKDLDSTIKTLIIINPVDSLINEGILNKIDKFLSKGGNVFLSYNNATNDLQSMKTEKENKQISDWLFTKKISVNTDVITDMNCTSISIQRQQGMYIINDQIPFPYIFFVQNFSKHPISKSLTNVILKFVSTFRINPDTLNTKYEPLMFTSQKANKELIPVEFNLERQWEEKDFVMKDLPIGYAISGQDLGNKYAKMVVIPNGDFMIEQGKNGIMPDNINLFVNSRDWLSDDTGLIDLRTKVASFRNLNDLSNGKKEFLKYLNFLLPIILVILLSLFRFQYKKRQSLIRKSKNYE